MFLFVKIKPKILKWSNIVDKADVFYPYVFLFVESKAQFFLILKYFNKSDAS